MSALTCTSCGASNSAELVYCSACGAPLARMGPPVSGTAAEAALFKRGSVSSAAEIVPRPGLVSRFLRILIYPVLVAAGVLVVLALMDPGTMPPQEQRLPDPSAVVRRVFAASRFAPSALSQPLINSLLARQQPFAPESPVRLIPMPVWDNAWVLLAQDTVTLHVTMTFVGRPLRIAETFRLKGVPGDWFLEPKSASVGMLRMPAFLLPAATVLVRPAVLGLGDELGALRGARSLVIRNGLVELITR